jgi:hypothetical protein
MLGDIERRNVRMFVADGDELNVLGMNYLSSLTAGAWKGAGWYWKAEERQSSFNTIATLHNTYYQTGRSDCAKAPSPRNDGP